jgi:hypothetical protein
MLIIEFSRWAKDWGFHEADDWVRAHRAELATYQDFVTNFPRTTPGYRHVQTVLGYYENLGLFYRHNVIDVDLLFDRLNFVDPWQRLSHLALGLRAQATNPALWTSFEQLATDQREWLEKQGR